MTKASRSDALDIMLLVGSILALGVSLLAAGSMAAIAGINNILQLLDNAQAAWSVAFIFSLMGILTIPGLYLSYRSINGRPPLVSRSLPTAYLLVGVGFPLALALGTLSARADFLPYFFEPLAHVIAALTPMLFLSVLVVRQLPLIPWRRIWGHVSGGLWVSPTIALVLELLAAIPLVAVIFAYVMTEVDPREFIQPFTSGAPLDEGTLNAQLEALLDQPLLVITGLLFVTVLVPLLEEMIKTISLWPMLRRGVRPIYAFAAGAVMGGAYGLFEALFLAQPGEGWAALMVARAGATSMHMLTTALASMGFALAIEKKKLTVALRYYLFAVVMHGVWNLAAIGVAIVSLFQGDATSAVLSNGAVVVSVGSGILLVLLTAGAVSGLHLIPGYLLKRGEIQAPQEISAGLS
ncbi:MAG: PrsW family glutamic-type intramembrane protease [Anaerolineales bacterium]